jgi:hypothetical protein
MAHEQDLASLQTLQAGQEQNDASWPVPFAIATIAGISIALWAALLAISHWLVG